MDITSDEQLAFHDPLLNLSMVNRDRNVHPPLLVRLAAKEQGASLVQNAIQKITGDTNCRNIT